MRCPACLLPDPYQGDGDGIGSCDCIHCRTCGQVDEWCICSDYDENDPWGDDEEDY